MYSRLPGSGNVESVKEIFEQISAVILHQDSFALVILLILIFSSM
jgi:hypothetical protein